MQEHPQKSNQNVTRIIPAANSHVSQIAEIWKEFIDFHKEIDPLYTPREDGPKIFGDFVRSLIASEDSQVLAAMDGSSVVAYSICQIGKYPPVLRSEKYGFISDLAVKASHRRRGIGELLLGHIFDWCESRNLNRIELHVAPKNEAGYSFWKKHGFRDCTHALYIDRGHHER